ncbi:MAG: 3-oxoacyl-ACP reductase FabG [Lachnospiraceae bacterium]
MQKTVLITGASRGIGKSIALAYAKLQYNVVITCLKEEEQLKSVERELIKYGANCLIFIGDMGDPQVVMHLFSEIEQRFQGIDILINNVGISYVGLITDMTNLEWKRILDTNLSSVFYCSRAVVPYMVHQKSGKIVNISSVWGQVGASCEVAYSATKAGVQGMTRALAKELAPSNIQVNALALGMVNTSMNGCFSVEEKSRLAEDIPAGRFAEPNEIADIIINLTTNGNEYMTGQIITVDGGWI